MLRKSEHKIIFIQWIESSKNSYAGSQGLCNNSCLGYFDHPPILPPQKNEFFIILFNITTAFKIVIQQLNNSTNKTPQKQEISTKEYP